MKQTLALSDAEIDELDDFLMSDDTPENCMDISALDGFFAALVLNPAPVMPSEYVPWIWDMEEGEDAPSFASVEQANHIMALLMRYYNSVLDAIDGEHFSPLFYILTQPDGSLFYEAEGWSEGFMRGVYLFSEPWMEIFEQHHVLIAPMVLLGTEAGWELLENSTDAKQKAQSAYESIANTVTLIYAYFTETRKMQSSLVHTAQSDARFESAGIIQIGDNEDCPCGSGKKFINCCSAPPTVH